MFDESEFDISDLELEVPEFEPEMLKAPDLSALTYTRPTLEELRSVEGFFAGKPAHPLQVGLQVLDVVH